MHANGCKLIGGDSGLKAFLVYRALEALKEIYLPRGNQVFDNPVSFQGSYGNVLGTARRTAPHASHT